MEHHEAHHRYRATAMAQRQVVGKAGKQYGLQARLIFDEAEEEEAPQEVPGAYGNPPQKSGMSLRKLQEEMEDSEVYQYDEVLDDIHQERRVAQARAKAEREERKPRYVQSLLSKAKRREQELDLVRERKLKKEREEEDALYGDKEKFVTSAYKKKLEERREFEEEQKRQEALEAQQDVAKKGTMQGFYQNVLGSFNNRSRSDAPATSDQDKRSSSPTGSKPLQESSRKQGGYISGSSSDSDSSPRRSRSDRRRSRSRSRSRSRNRYRSPSRSRSPHRRRERYSRSPVSRDRRSSRRYSPERRRDRHHSYRHRSRSPRRRYRSRSRSSSRDRYSHRRHRSSEDRHRRHRSRSRSPRDGKGERERRHVDDKAMVDLKKRQEAQALRKQKYLEVWAVRNTDADISAARQRFLARQQQRQSGQQPEAVCALTSLHMVPPPPAEDEAVHADVEEEEPATGSGEEGGSPSADEK